jgi:integrase/recombinase XerC
VTAVNGYFKWATRRGYIVDDPSTILTIPKIRKGEPRPIGEDDLELALLAAPTTGMLAMLRLMCDAGLRCCEVAAFHRQDLDDTVKPNILFVRGGKGATQRRVPVGQAVRTAIIRTGVKAGPLFPKANAHGHMTRVEVSRRVNEHLHGLGIPDTAHTLRHRYLTVGFQWTRDIRLVQELAGHASPATTAIYTRYSPQNADDLIAHFDDLAGAA